VSDAGWPTRDEILGGLPARRAWTLLFLIESEASRRVALVREASSEIATERRLAERETADLEAFALGREPTHRPSIQELEQTHDAWAPLVPANPRLRAAVAKLLGERHRFPRHLVPGIRAALGLDDEEVREAFRRQEGVELDTIYTLRISPRERLRFGLATPATWLEQADPGWAAAALTFALGVSQPLLALPIALATCGPAIGLAIVVVLGACSALATAAMAEAVVRSADVRHRGAFFGRLVTGLLGATSGSIPVGLTVVRAILSMLAAFVGLATTLAADTPVPTWVWATLGIVGVLLTTVGRKRSASLAALMLIGVLATVGLLVLGTWSVVHAAVDGTFSLDALTTGGTHSGVAGYAALVGIAVMSLVNPVYTVQFARVLLPRDPRGERFIRGSILGAVALALLTAVFGALVVLGVPADQLAAERSTVLVTLGDELGPAAVVLGVPILLGIIGLTLNRNGAALVDLVLEALPSARTTEVVLPRRHGELVLGDRVRIVFRGIEQGAPALQVTLTGESGRKVLLEGPWRHEEPLVELEPLASDDDHVRLRVTSPLRASTRRVWDRVGPSALDAVLDSGEDASLVVWLTRRGEATVAEVAERMGEDPDAAQARVNRLAETGRLRVADSVVRPDLGARRGRHVPDAVWEKLGAEAPAEETPRRGLRDLLATPGARIAVSAAPSIAVFVAAVVLLGADAVSFSEPLEIAGVLTGLTVAGMLPVLLVLAARRSSELAPGSVPRGLSPAQVLAALVAFGVLVLYGLVLWKQPGQRIADLVAALAVVGVSFAAARGGAFKPGLALELLAGSERGRFRFAAVNGGGPPFGVSAGDGAEPRPAPSGGIVEGEAEALLTLAGQGPCPRVKVWSPPGGDDERRPVRVILRQEGAEVAATELHIGGEEVAWDAGPGPWELTVRTPDPPKPVGKRRGVVSLPGL
jgi:hypothetical protein